ncbi:beta-propeller fold lactonase family protein [Mycobacterium barrassiae]|uniref:YVTN family beta-propeller repeat protein n=1 Tax=Mycobacterium barrassiae TaxID=319709 RepID=UPI002265EC44|nr:beta-propeller fold lactonase family protein [Mycobacterium barrassiae]MCV7298436.1 beta-propeller fold lactonase family protein [Mycobacterium barrassiae]
MADNDSRPAAQPTYESPVQNEPAPETKLDEPDVDVPEEPALREIESAVTVPVTAISTVPDTAPVSVTEPVEVAAAPVDEVPDLMAGVLAWVGLGPVSADAPALPPVEAPALWGLLEFARRQEQQTLSNRAPTIAYDPKETVELADGTIFGDLRAVDPNGDPLTFTVTQQPEHGTVVVHRDGTFTYTPDADAESARPEVDTFTIDISDGLAKRGQGPAVSVTITLNKPPQLFDPVTVGDDIDPSPEVKVTPHVVDTIDVGDTPFGVAVSPDSNTVYVTNTEDDTVSVIDAATNTIIATIAVGDQPAGIAVSPDGSTVYVANATGGTVSVIDSASNTVTATVNLGVTAYTMVVSADGSRVYVANALEDSVTVIDAATNTVVATYITGDNPGGLALSADGSTLYVANNFAASVSVFDTATGATIDVIDVGDVPISLALSPDGTRLYVTDDGPSDTISVIDTATNAVIAVIDDAWNPMGLAFSADGTYLYVSGFGAGTNEVSVINTSTNTIVATVTVGDGAWQMAMVPDGDHLYVVNYLEGTVSVIAL